MSDDSLDGSFDDFLDGFLDGFLDDFLDEIPCVESPRPEAGGGLRGVSSPTPDVNLPNESESESLDSWVSIGLDFELAVLEA